MSLKHTGIRIDSSLSDPIPSGNNRFCPQVGP